MLFNNNCNNNLFLSFLLYHFALLLLIFVNCDNDAKLMQAVVQQKSREYKMNVDQRIYNRKYIAL